MSVKTDIDPTRLRELWATSMTCAEIGAVFGCSGQRLSKRAMSLGLPRRYNRRPDPAPPPQPSLQDRPDYPALVAACKRAKGIEAVTPIATRFRVPYAAVLGLMGVAG